VEYEVYDGEIPGLALRVNPSGRKRGSITPEQARRLAKERLAEVTRCGEPAGDRRRARQAPNMAALVDRYRKEHLAFKKASTRDRADGLFMRILALHRSHRETQVEANRAVTLLSGIFTWAEDGGVVLLQGSPCCRVKEHAECRHERYLSAQELGRLGVALARADEDGTELQAAIIAIRLLLLSG